MATRQELENMVMQFKVTDLQLLLGFAGQNKNGKKQELQRKVLNLIHFKMSIPLEMKIRHIYREMVVENNAQPVQDYFYPTYDKYDNYFVNNGYSGPAASSLGYDGYNTRHYYSKNNSDNCYDNWPGKNIFSSNCNNTGSLQEAQSSKFDYMSYLEPCTKIPDSQKLKNTVFKRLSFFKFKSDVVPLTPVIAKTKRTDLFEYTLTFSLNSQHQSLINWSKKNERECRHQIQLRMCLLDSNTGMGSRKDILEDSLPLALGIKLNEKPCQLPPAIPSTNKQGMLLKRMNAPINLTPQTSKKLTAYTLVINWSVECDKLYGVAVHIVEKFTSDDLINKLKDKGERDPAVTKKYVEDKLNELADDDISATSLKVSLICPLGKILMTLPVRATTCQHLQCFDGTLYIKMNEVKSVWQCPVCNQTCYYEDLFIDGYFTNVFKNETFKSDVTEIQINADGSIEPVVTKKRGNISPDGPSPRKKIKTSDENCGKKVPSVEQKDSANATPDFLPLFSTEPTQKEIPKKANDTIHHQEEIPEKTNVIVYHEKEISKNTNDFFTDHQNSIESSSSVPSCLEKTNKSSSILSVDSSASFSSDSNACNVIEDVENYHAIKKNVVLVDLTESDSENEEHGCNGAPLKTVKEDNIPSPSEDSCKKKYPPIFDIEDSE